MPGTDHAQWAQSRRPARVMRHRGPRDYASLERLLAAAEELNLSTSQQDKLRAIRRSAPGILMPKEQAAQEARLDLADLMARKNASSAELRSAHERLVQARSAIATARFDLRMQAREVLTEQQREKLREGLKANRRPMRQGALMPPPDGAFGPEEFGALEPGFDAFESGDLDEFELDAPPPPPPPGAPEPGHTGGPDGASNI
jgi:Spy/CpxP family protein refolding chaperone